MAGVAVPAMPAPAVGLRDQMEEGGVGVSGADGCQDGLTDEMTVADAV